MIDLRRALSTDHLCSYCSDPIEYDEWHYYDTNTDEHWHTAHMPDGDAEHITYDA
jgi:hypothetical protein